MLDLVFVCSFSASPPPLKAVQAAKHERKCQKDRLLVIETRNILRRCCRFPWKLSAHGQKLEYARTYKQESCSLTPLCCLQAHVLLLQILFETHIKATS